jgi:hypothetical protein
VLAASAAAAAVIAAVAVPVALRGSPGHGAAPVQVKLVAYTGAQPQGYLVKAIPAGWVIQGSNNYNLVIAPAGDPDKSPDSFLGKLLVTQEEFDAAGAASTGWVAMTAGGRAAYYNDGASDAMARTAGLVIRQASGQWLLVQAPTFLGWSQQQLAQFALGVTITATATPGKG